MLILSDMGTDVVNSDATFSFNIGQAKDGTTALVAHGLNVQVILAAVGDRPPRALEAIVKGVKERRHFLDLGELLGPRPNLAIASALVSENGRKLVG
jgi:hypothetical protein